MKKVKLVVGTSIIAGALLFSNNVADGSLNKENGAIQYGDNDLKDFESAGSLNLDNYED